MNPDLFRLQTALEWHAKITVELQTRIVDARRYVNKHNGDPELLRILAGQDNKKGTNND